MSWSENESIIKWKSEEKGKRTASLPTKEKLDGLGEVGAKLVKSTPSKEPTSYSLQF